MWYAIALLLIGVILVAASFYLATQRALGSPPNFAPPRQATRPETVDGCMTCVLAASGGDDILRRHLTKAHRG